MKQGFRRKIINLVSSSQIVENLSRQKCMSSCLVALLMSRSVQLSELSHYLNDEVKRSSNETRLQDFFRETEFDYSRVGILLLSLLKRKVKLTLTIDRTEWDFGKCQVNILMVIVSDGQIHVPLYWEMLDNKSGNSNSGQRKDLLKKCITLVGKERIGLLLADREFVGHEWLSYLKAQGIRFCIRIPEHHLITDDQGNQHRASELLIQGKERLLKEVMVDGVWGNAYLKSTKKGNLFFVFGTAQVEYLGQLYSKRWKIETLFQAFKSRGFNLKKTHLKNFERLSKMVALVSIAFAFCISVGKFLHEKVKTIPLKKHQYKAKSFFRHGLDFIREILTAKKKRSKEYKKLIKLIFRWLSICYSTLKPS